MMLPWCYVAIVLCLRHVRATLLRAPPFYAARDAPICALLLFPHAAPCRRSCLFCYIRPYYDAKMMREPARPLWRRRWYLMRAITARAILIALFDIRVYAAYVMLSAFDIFAWCCLLIHADTMTLFVDSAAAYWYWVMLMLMLRAFWCLPSAARDVVAVCYLRYLRDFVLRCQLSALCHAMALFWCLRATMLRALRYFVDIRYVAWCFIPIVAWCDMFHYFRVDRLTLHAARTCRADAELSFGAHAIWWVPYIFFHAQRSILLRYYSALSRCACHAPLPDILLFDTMLTLSYHDLLVALCAMLDTVLLHVWCYAMPFSFLRRWLSSIRVFIRTTFADSDALMPLHSRDILLWLRRLLIAAYVTCSSAPYVLLMMRSRRYCRFDGLCHWCSAVDIDIIFFLFFIAEFRSLLLSPATYLMMLLFVQHPLLRCCLFRCLLMLPALRATLFDIYARVPIWQRVYDIARRYAVMRAARHVCCCYERDIYAFEPICYAAPEARAPCWRAIIFDITFYSLLYFPALFCRSFSFRCHAAIYAHDYRHYCSLPVAAALLSPWRSCFLLLIFRFMLLSTMPILRAIDMLLRSAMPCHRAMLLIILFARCRWSPYAATYFDVDILWWRACCRCCYY